MSAESQTFVEDLSPYKGSTYDVHLRLGLLANDGYSYRIFCGDDYLQWKCRCSERAVKKAKAELIRDGSLKLIAPATGQNVAEYEFLFKGQEHLRKEGGKKRKGRVQKAVSTPTYINECKESENLSISDPVDLKAQSRRLDEIFPERRSRKRVLDSEMAS